MIVPIGHENMNPVRLALLNAQHDLAFLHGTRVTDVDDVRYTWEIDNNDTLKLIDEALALLDKAEHNHT